MRPTEHRQQVLGKTLLTLSLSNELPPQKIISTRHEDNPLISTKGRQVIDKLIATVGNHDSLAIGLHGSHAVGLNGVESDMDLIAWTTPAERIENLYRINDSLLRLGYTPANDTKKFNEYSVRISNLTGHPIQIGAFLAEQRNRWISPQGIDTSLQLIDMPYSHDTAKPLLEQALNEEIEAQGRIYDYPLEIEWAQPFNYPRLWRGTVKGDDCHIISFNMVHQGMGAERLKDGSPSGDQVLTAARYILKDGKVVYCLQNDNDYILPKRLIAQ